MFIADATTATVNCGNEPQVVDFLGTISRLLSSVGNITKPLHSAETAVSKVRYLFLLLPPVPSTAISLLQTM